MCRDAHSTGLWLVALFLALATTLFTTGAVRAADLIWQVENPFRFFKSTHSFAMHEAAFNAARGNPAAPLPADIVWRTERKLNDPDCKDPSTPDRCAETAGPRYQQSRFGWAAQTLNDNCYEVDGRPRRYSPVCERKYSWGSAREDYILPEAHTVQIGIAPEHLAGVTGDCTWTWQPRKAGGRPESKKIACKDKLTIARVPYSLDRAASGVSVSVSLPDGRVLVDHDVVVEDLFIVALGDSFASGESNPDRPVQFSASRQMVYDPKMVRDEVASTDLDKKPALGNMGNGFGLASAEDQFNPKVLPKRYMEDEQADRVYKPNTPEFQAAFDKVGARWLSRDCHRSQYGYPFRVGIEMALENRHRSITFASFTCSGAEIAEGLFGEMDAREGFSDPAGAKVKAQFDQLSDLICRGGASARTEAVTYTIPDFTYGSTQLTTKRITKMWCPPQLRKRPVDMVMMSIGGNDVGFGALAAYAITDNASDFAPIATWVGSSIRFGPPVARVYLSVLDQRMEALKHALADGFGITPPHVLQSSYEPIQFDETGALCGSQPTLGMDVHPGLKLDRGRLAETADFLKELQAKLECISSTQGKSCPGSLATGTGTGFTLVTDHLAEFTKRGMCARDPKRALADGIDMRVPRVPVGGNEFKPYSPAGTLTYEHRWRLFRSPNDAFLAANTHREGISMIDTLQPAWAGLYSGAIHPTAEGHAIVADHIVRHARLVLDKQGAGAETAKAQ